MWVLSYKLRFMHGYYSPQRGKVKMNHMNILTNSLLLPHSNGQVLNLSYCNLAIKGNSQSIWNKMDPRMTIEHYHVILGS